MRPWRKSEGTRETGPGRIVSIVPESVDENAQRRAETRRSENPNKETALGII